MLAQPPSQIPQSMGSFPQSSPVMMQQPYNTMPLGSRPGMIPTGASSIPFNQNNLNVPTGSFPIGNVTLNNSSSGYLSPGNIQQASMTQNNQAYPLTYMQNSPLSHLGYSYPQTFPTTSSPPGGYGYVQGAGYGYQTGAHQYSPRPSSTGMPLSPSGGIKSQEDLIRGTFDQSAYNIGQGGAISKDNHLLVTSASQGGIAGLPYSHSQHIGVQQGFSQI